MKDLGTLGGKDSAAYGIDGSGRVVGEANALVTYTDDLGTTITFDVGPHAFLWADSNANGASDPGEMQDLGTLGGDTSAAYGLNSAGQVVGYSDTSFGSTPFLWDSLNGMRDLIDRSGSTGVFTGSARGAALGINSYGAAVGWADDVNGVRLAFLWKNGVMIDLNTLLPANSGWRLFQATAINDSGQIVGYGTLNGGTAYPHAFLMTPTAP
jgi:probable HAF family extracellular repeat protein